MHARCRIAGGAAMNQTPPPAHARAAHAIAGFGDFYMHRVCTAAGMMLVAGFSSIRLVPEQREMCQENSLSGGGCKVGPAALHHADVCLRLPWHPSLQGSFLPFRVTCTCTSGFLPSLQGECSMKRRIALSAGPFWQVPAPWPGCVMPLAGVLAPPMLSGVCARGRMSVAGV